MIDEIEAGSTLDAELYMAVHRGVAGDIERYRAACRGTHRVLELGCGNGRVLRQLVPVLDTTQPLELVGLDDHGGMLELAARAQPNLRWVHGRMEAPQLDQRFERILIPFSGLWCLPPDEKRACLQWVASHLTQHGALCFDVYHADELDREGEGAEHEVVDGFEFLEEVALGQARFGVFEKNRYWFSERRVEAQFQYFEASAPDVVVCRQRIVHHYLPEPELTELLHSVGLVRVEADRSVFSALDEEHGQLYVEARLQR